MKYDLHTHTVNSDGEFTISQNVDRAVSLGLDGIAITDHDNIESWSDIDNNNYPIPVIKGVELSTYYNGENIHVLGYYLNDGGDYSELDEFLKRFRKLRDERVYKIIDLLKQFDIYIEYKDVIKYADGSIGRPHIAKAIIEKYPERNYTINYIFDNFIGTGKPAYVKTADFQTKDSVDLLHRNHCIAVLAHPLLINKNKVNYKELFQFPFDGVEVFYPNVNYSYVLEYANSNNLIVTGGSDFHGPNTKDSMGMEFNQEPYLNKFLERINRGK